MKHYDALIDLLENSGFDRDAEAAAAIKELIAERKDFEYGYEFFKNETNRKLAELTKQRDDLFEKLERLADLFADFYRSPGFYAESVEGLEEARAAIARVKESK